ncbi:BppU family phage baseplate upper protein, partial [Proteiniclasticum sp.]|uniref:BppU family phage baseplate upper protein n=1 Tax=Proteiniclasticum sp. TaxID=2053595 RepID=UPI00289A62B0
MIRPKLFSINLDLKNKNYITDIIVSQGDQLSNVFRFNLVQDSLPYDLTSLSVKAYFERPDKFTSFIAGQLVDAAKGIVDVELTNQILNTPGVCACQVMIVGTENEILSSLKILFAIEKSVNYSAVESTNEYNALVDALSNVQSIRNEFDIVIANATVDSEVILARGGNTTLKERLDNVDAQLADIESGERIAEGAIKIKHIDPLAGSFLPEVHDFVKGEYNGGVIQSSSVRAVTQFNIVFSERDEIISMDNNISFYVYYEKKDGSGFANTSWMKQLIIPSSLAGTTAGISVKYDDGRTITTQNLLEIADAVIVSGGNIAASRKELRDMVNEISPLMIEFVKGGVNPDGSTSTANTRARTIDYFDVSVGTIVYLKDENLKMAIVREGITGYIRGSWLTSNSYTFADSGRVMVMIAFKDDRALSHAEILLFSENFYIIDDKTPLAMLPKGMIDTGSSIGSEKPIYYVTLSGNDSNSGLSIGNSLATLQKALDLGATKVLMQRGIYYNQTISKDVENLEIYPLNNDVWDTEERKQVQKIEFRGSYDISGSWLPYNAIFRKAYSGNTLFNEVFITKTLPPETATTRPSYNATIWECSNLVDDYKMKPVLTLTECESEQGTFFYDGIHVYIHPMNSENEFQIPILSNVLRLSGNKICLEDVSVNFAMGRPADLRSIKSLKAQNCEASYSVSGNGFTLDYTNGDLVNCKAYKNRNDGFNLHYYGDTKLVNCEGSYNYDDGISHHDGCTGVIIGGKWNYNGKGGIAPAYGARVNWYNTIL